MNQARHNPFDPFAQDIPPEATPTPSTALALASVPTPTPAPALALAHAPTSASAIVATGGSNANLNTTIHPYHQPTTTQVQAQVQTHLQQQYHQRRNHYNAQQTTNTPGNQSTALQQQWSSVYQNSITSSTAVNNGQNLSMQHKQHMFHNQQQQPFPSLPVHDPSHHYYQQQQLLLLQQQQLSQQGTQQQLHPFPSSNAIVPAPRSAPDISLANSSQNNPSLNHQNSFDPFFQTQNNPLFQISQKQQNFLDLQESPSRKRGDSSDTIETSNVSISSSSLVVLENAMNQHHRALTNKSTTASVNTSTQLRSPTHTATRTLSEKSIFSNNSTVSPLGSNSERFSHSQFSGKGAETMQPVKSPLSSSRSLNSETSSTYRNTSRFASTSTNSNYALQDLSSSEDVNATMPDQNLVISTGFILSRISLRTIFLKKWKQTYWMHYGRNGTIILLFRSKEDADDWLRNPYHGKKEREFLVKLKLDFIHDLEKPNVRGYRAAKMTVKPYKNHTYQQFKLERWMDYGPAIAAAFASNQAEETIAIRNAVLKCMENSPRHINWENYNIKANNGGSRMAGSENNNNFTSGRIQGIPRSSSERNQSSKSSYFQYDAGGISHSSSERNQSSKSSYFQYDAETLAIDALKTQQIDNLKSSTVAQGRYSNYKL